MDSLGERYVRPPPRDPSTNPLLVPRNQRRGGQLLDPRSRPLSMLIDKLGARGENTGRRWQIRIWKFKREKTYQVSDRGAAIGETRASKKASQESQNQETSEVIHNRGRDRQYDKKEKSRDIDPIASNRRNLAQRRKKEWTNSIPNQPRTSQDPRLLALPPL